MCGDQRRYGGTASATRIDPGWHRVRCTGWDQRLVAGQRAVRLALDLELDVAHDHPAHNLIAARLSHALRRKGSPETAGMQDLQRGRPSL